MLFFSTQNSLYFFLFVLPELVEKKNKHAQIFCPHNNKPTHARQSRCERSGKTCVEDGCVSVCFLIPCSPSAMKNRAEQSHSMNFFLHSADVGWVNPPSIAGLKQQKRLSSNVFFSLHTLFTSNNTVAAMRRGVWQALCHCLQLHLWTLKRCCNVNAYATSHAPCIKTPHPLAGQESLSTKY